MVRRRFVHYLGESGGLDLADQIANSSFEDPVPEIWLSPVDADDENAEWNASWQLGEEVKEFSGSRDKAVAWARGQPAVTRMVLVGQEYTELDPLPDDASAPPAVGPTVQVLGPDHDGRWVALWYHRGEQRQFWGSRAEVMGWAFAQPAERRFIGWTTRAGFRWTDERRWWPDSRDRATAPACGECGQTGSASAPNSLPWRPEARPVLPPVSPCLDGDETVVGQAAGRVGA